MPSINGAYTWAVNCCNLPNVGYSQAYRNQQTVNGITYYDCSSFINYALLSGGFSTPQYAPNNNAFTTYDMEGVLQQLGFTRVTDGVIKAGDIGVSDTHTEMCYKGGTGKAVFMGAHGRNGIALVNQVSIGSSSGDPNYERTFPRIWRYGDGASGEVGYTWIIGGESEYFEDYGDKQKNNSACIYSFFYFKGWTLQAIAGLCGNVMQESKFNPALIEIGGTGHGLVQWTPPSNLYDVLDVLYGSHDDWQDGNKQCNVLYAEYEESTGLAHRGIEPQWYPSSYSSMDWKTWASSTQDPGELALIFQANYERPASLHPERAEYARKWFDILKLIDPKQPGYNTHDPKKYNMPIWMMINYRL
jgi:hypothetical protein